MMTESEIRALAKASVKLAGATEDIDQVPLSIDLVAFVIWLRETTDFFSGPDLDLHYPKADDVSFTSVLADHALAYTGE